MKLTPVILLWSAGGVLIAAASWINAGLGDACGWSGVFCLFSAIGWFFSQVNEQSDSWRTGSEVPLLRPIKPIPPPPPPPPKYEKPS